jgi:hypothetical protein
VSSRVHERQLYGTTTLNVNELCLDERTRAVTFESTLQLRHSGAADVN